MPEPTWSASVLRKAEKYLREDRVSQDPSHPEVWWVRGTATRGDGEAKPYRVQVGFHQNVTDLHGQPAVAYAICTCPFGQQFSGEPGAPGCTHTGAVLLSIERDRKSDGS